MCVYNQMMKNRKYTKTKKNKGKVPTLPDRRVEYIPIGCGNCMECRKQKANEWRVRLSEHIKTNTNGKFITLTLANESIAEISKETIKKTHKETNTIRKISIKELRGYDKDNAIATVAARKFNERWRERYGKAIQHWLITELGHQGTENIHLHGIVWVNDIVEHTVGRGKKKQTIRMRGIDAVRELWRYGWIWPRPEYKRPTWVNAQTVNYMMKYVMKIDLQHKEYKPKILCSPGIGKEFVESIEGEKTMLQQREWYRTNTGHQIGLPTYYRNKLFSDEERERLWIARLDKEERWVDKVKYDISKGEEEWKKAVQLAREKNNKLGYGGRVNENRKEYEEDRREIMIETRIQKGMKKQQDKQGMA